MSASVEPRRLGSLDSYYVESRGLYQPGSARLLHLAASISLTIAALYWLDRGLRADRILVDLDQPRGELVFIAAPPQQLIERPRTTPRTKARNSVVPDRVSTDDQADPSPPSNAITTAPVVERSIDWSQQSAISAAAAVNALTKQDDTLDSKPKVIELPGEGSKSKAGLTQHLGGGEMITWINDRCYVTNMPPPGPTLDANKVNTVCKRPGEGDGMMFDHLRPSHLGGPKSEAGRKKASE